MTDLGGASVRLGYNVLKELESNEAALDAIVQHISRSTTTTLHHSPSGLICGN